MLDADTRATLRIGAPNLSALNDVNNGTDGQVLTWVAQPGGIALTERRWRNIWSCRYWYTHI